jgi:hypothetical protein
VLPVFLLRGSDKLGARPARASWRRVAGGRRYGVSSVFVVGAVTAGVCPGSVEARSVEARSVEARSVEAGGVIASGVFVGGVLAGRASS